MVMIVFAPSGLYGESRLTTVAYTSEVPQFEQQTLALVTGQGLYSLEDGEGASVKI